VLFYIRVKPPFFAKTAFRAVSGDKDGVIPHGPQAFADAAEQLGMVAARKIGATYAPGKQHVAHKGAPGLGAEKHHMAGRMPRAMAHQQRALAQGDGIAIGQPASGYKRLGSRKSKHRTLLGQSVNPVLVSRVRAYDGQRQLRSQLRCSTRMVDVRMGEPNGGERDRVALRSSQDAGQVTTGVDDCANACDIAPHQRAVLLKCSDGNCFVFQHRSIFTEIVAAS
jgi:hypothetical protein